MPMAKEQLESFIKSAFPDADITITDLAGDDDHWSVKIISSAFSGKSRVLQHKMVYQALQGNMGGALHALQLQTHEK